MGLPHPPLKRVASIIIIKCLLGCVKYFGNHTRRTLICRYNERQQEMPKKEGSGDKKSNQYKEGKITFTKTEGVIQNDTPTKDASRWQQMIEHEEEIKEKEIREKRIVTILQLHIFCFDVIFIA